MPQSQPESSGNQMKLHRQRTSGSSDTQIGGWGLQCIYIYIYTYIKGKIERERYIHTNIYRHLFIDAFFCRPNCPWPQNMPQFPISLLNWSQTSFPGAFFWGLQTASSCLGPDLENWVGVQAIWSTIHVVLPSLWHGSFVLVKRGLFLFHLGLFFWQFFPSTAPIMLYNICYWSFFFSQGNWWTKYLVHPKIWNPKPCLLMFVSLVTLNSFHLLLSTQLTADLTLEWSGGSMFHPLSYIYAKTPFSCVKTVATNTLNRQHVVVFDRLCAYTAPTLNTAFSLTDVQTKWWIHCLLQPHCYLMQPQFMISQNEFVEFFLVFTGTTAEFGQPECSASFVSLQQI